MAVFGVSQVLILVNWMFFPVPISLCIGYIICMYIILEQTFHVSSNK